LHTETELVERCLKGDEAAWEDIVRRNTQRVFNLCYRFTSSRAQAEDLSQEVFLRVYRTLHTYRAAEGNLTTWLMRVTRNLLIDHYRRTKKDRVTDSLEDQLTEVEQQESQAPSPELFASRGELGEKLERALARLSPDLREAIILRDLQGLEYVEIQRVLDIPEGTVKSRINRGRIELARVLQQMGVAKRIGR
jgi:RNA polymerase sigma-70 factor (ECF subfamily)